MDTGNEIKKPKDGFFSRTNPLWIIFAFLAWYILLGGILHIGFEYLCYVVQPHVSNAFLFTLEMYTATICDIIAIFLITWCFKHNRFIWKSFLLPKKYDSLELDEEDLAAEFYGRSRNSIGQLWKGILLGFLTNFFCILCALIHGDIKLYFDAKLSEIPFFVFALISVCIQSTAEELWCRGFLYERLHEKFPLWVAIVVNGSIFGLLHLGNPGVTVLSIISIIVCGLSYSILRWYTGNIWIAMGIHTGWNFTQNFLFGLPNSGLVSEASIFHLDASTGISNLIYDYGFGVEGALPAIFADAFVAVLCLILAKKAGRLGELKLKRVLPNEQDTAC